jgi:hypothetical protein
MDQSALGDIRPLGERAKPQYAGEIATIRSRQSVMQKNQLYMLVGALAVVVIGLGIYVYQKESEPSGVQIRLDESGVSVEQN